MGTLSDAACLTLADGLQSVAVGAGFAEQQDCEDKYKAWGQKRRVFCAYSGLTYSGWLLLVLALLQLAAMTPI